MQPPSLARVLSASSINVDVNGSPVTIAAADWLVCFVPALKRQWWHRFANAKHKHVFALRMIDDERWLLVEPWWTRVMVNVLTVDEATRFLLWAACGDVLKVREAIPGRGNQFRGWSNCAVLISLMLGRSYWTWTPNGLYRKLKAETDVQPVEPAQFLSKYLAAGAWHPRRDRDAAPAREPLHPAAASRNSYAG